MASMAMNLLVMMNWTLLEGVPGMHPVRRLLISEVHLPFRSLHDTPSQRLVDIPQATP